MRGVVHRVDERHAVIDELGKILVTRRNENIEPLVGSLFAQCPDDVVGLDAFDLQERQAHRLYGLEDRLDLAAQVVGHRRPVRLVLGKHFVAKRFAGRVEHDGNLCIGLLAHELVDHRQHAVQRARRLACGVRQVG